MTGEFSEDQTAVQAETKDIVVSQQASINGQTGRVLEIIAADIVTVDAEERGLFAGLANFVRAKPMYSVGAMERAMAPVSQALRSKARSLGADAVLNVRIHTTRGVDVRGGRLIRLSAIGTAVRLEDSK
ncbi:MAG: heavy metal-binding domain-containing protein [Pseudomonadales bacterium]